ncbi:MAG TPA: twin-arginine translocation signal domain-containing protein [Verrucomicrobiae bacterium]
MDTLAGMIIDRRGFLKLAAAASVGTLVGGARVGGAEPTASTEVARSGKHPIIWGNLLHLSTNMWCDWDAPELKGDGSIYRPELRFDRSLWNDLLKKMQQAGMNMVVNDLGDGVKYKSHPEIAIKGAWSTAELRGELKRMRALGLEPIPKLNFSTTHDAWLGKYARCVSTDTYYAVCRDLIAEVMQLFDRPRFFHLGMDEEDYGNQKYYEHVVIRQYDAWWRDFLLLVAQVEKSGARAWIWSDYVWHHPELFYRKMPKSVVQSNWYYDAKFDPQKAVAKAFRELDQHGYDQIPTGSNYYNSTNFELLAEECRRSLGAGHLLGFLQTPWKPTVEKYR